jgi:O-methyltransferase domain/Dimerisation domain
MPFPPRAQAAAALRQIAFGLRASQALYVAAKLNVADHLAQGPLDAEELSRSTEADAAALRRVMRTLCSLGVFAEFPSGKFSLNSTAELLRSDIPGSYRAAVLFAVGEVRWRCWSDLLGTVRAGGGGAERTLGMSLFDFYAAHPEESEIHDQAMRATSAAQVAAIVGAYDFSQAGVAIDVGGGTGELLAGVLTANSLLRGILFDLPHVVAHAQSVFTDNGVMDRVQTVGGSFFESVPAGGNTYLLKTVIHDWNDARATAILANCRRAMTAGGKLLIIERELPEVGAPGQTAEALLLDLEMLVMTPGGRERTRSEFARLLSDTQFRLARVLPTASPLSIFEAVAV